MSQCPFCAQETFAEQLFCERCGGSQVEPELSHARFRLRLFRNLLRNRIWVTRLGLRSLTRQAKLLCEMQQLGAFSTEQPRLEVQFMFNDFLTLAEDLHLAPLANLLEAVRPLVAVLSPTEFAIRFEDFASNLEAFIHGLRKTSTQMQKGNVSQRKLRKWFSQHVSQHDFDESFAEDVVYTTPHYWDYLATRLQPARYEQEAAQIAVNQGWYEFRQKNYGRAKSCFQKGFAEDATCTEALSGLISIAAQSGQHDEAIRISRKAIEVGTTNPQIFNAFAWYVATETPFTDPKDQELALAAARRTVELAPLASYCDTLAYVAHRMGLLAEAMWAIREALRDDPEKQGLKERRDEIVADIEKRHPQRTNAPEVPADSGEFELDEVADDGDAIVMFDDEDDCDAFEFDFDEFGDDFNAYEEDFSPLGSPIEDVADANFDEEDEATPRTTSPPVSSLVALPSTPRGNFEDEAGTKKDPVDCTVYAPAQVEQGDCFLVQIFAHVPSQAKQVEIAAKEFDEDAERRGCTSLATEIKHGSRLTFELRIKGVEIEEPVQHLFWRGRAEAVQFEVAVPDEAKLGTKIGTVLVSQDSVPIGQVKFKLKVVDEKIGPCKHEPTGEADRYRVAFISYASEDRAEVLRRVQMLKAAGIRFFQDVLNLDPGQRWEQSLYRHIDDSDVLFLFWSNAAKNSEWVAQEWSYALKTKGDDCVRPVIIEGPPIVPPPPELSHLHFNDQVLYFLAAS